MSRSSRPVPTAPALRRVALVAGVLIPAAVIVPTGAGAATPAPPTWATIQTPLAPQVRPEGDFASGALATTGNGLAAWAVSDASRNVATVWTVRDGAAVRVADVPLPGAGIGAVEVGTAKDGAPVLTLASRDVGTGPVTLRLVRLDTGEVRTIASVRRGLDVGGVAIDAGRLYSTVHARKVGARGTSSLWRATLTGTSVGRATKLRTSRRGERWNAVHADLGRVAVETSGAPDGDHGAAFLRESVAFGTPRGRWARTPDNYATDGGYVPVFVLGFTSDRKALVVERNLDDGPSTAAMVERRPIAGGRVRSARVGSGQADVRGSGYDPATGRLLAFGPDAAGTPSVGWTGRAFR